MTAKSQVTSPAEFLAARLDEKERFALIARLPAKHRARMLREVEAGRAILAMETETGSSSEWSGWAAARDDAIRHLAAIYSDHPDYRQEWAP